MPTIGWFEILIIVVIAIIILGPKDFPLMLKKVGSWIGSAKRYVNSVQNEVSSITEDTIDKNLNEEVNVNKKKDDDEQKSS
jgi:sec-independent protein translocase protein TatB